MKFCLTNARNCAIISLFFRDSYCFASVAQPVEQLIRNQQVACSSHVTSSKATPPRCGLFVFPKYRKAPAFLGRVPVFFQYPTENNGEAPFDAPPCGIVIFRLDTLLCRGKRQRQMLSVKTCLRRSGTPCADCIVAIIKRSVSISATLI